MLISRLNKNPCLSGRQEKFIRVAISCGDAAGISYEVVFKALTRFVKREFSVYFLVIGDKSVANFTSDYLKLNWRPHVVNCEEEISLERQRINFIDLGLIDDFSYKFRGQTNALFGRASLKYVEKAYKLIEKGEADCLVTAPINKEAVILAKRDFRGHTEFLAKLSKTKNFAMMIAGQKLKVTLVTRHIPLRRVSVSLGKESILSAIKLTNDYLKKFCKLKKPKIVLCALNPHAGEGGLVGKEEKEIIMPAARKALSEKINLVGPLASDSAFQKAYRGDFDAVICLYHDQGLIPLKMIERDESVNITLGLPFVRTSPVHGTAYDIAYQNKAESNSFFFAIKKAIEMVRNVRNDEKFLT
jgi:4-hydroxythreonine-4-phosphate dehydrogenase